MKQEKLFFELLRVAIGNAVCLSHTPTASEWNELYAMAKKQSLVGICFAGVQRLVTQRQSPPEMLYLQWMGMAAKIQQRNEVLNRQCAELQAKLSDLGMQSVVLKGQGVASLYSEPLRVLRQSGDIDLWLDAPKEKVVELAKEMGITEKAGYLHVGTMYKDTEVELHYRPTYMRNPWHNKRMQEYCFNFKGFQTVSGFREVNGMIVPPLEFDVVYQLSHIYRHLFGRGIGLRQLMDYYFVLKTLPSSLKGRGLDAIKCLGLCNIARAVMYVLQEVFCLKREHMLCQPDERRGKELLRHVMQTGNFGKMDKEQKVARQSLFGTMAYKVRQWWVLLRYYPSETIWCPYWAIVNRLNIL